MRTTDERKASAEKRAVWLRNYQRARGRALVRLAKQYPDQYKEILEEERLSDEANGKAWSDLSGGRASVMGRASSSNERGKVSFQRSRRNRKGKGKLGRKK